MKEPLITSDKKCVKVAWEDTRLNIFHHHGLTHKLFSCLEKSLVNRDCWFKKKLCWPKNIPTMKNPQFYSNSTENLVILSTHGLIILTKFDDNWTKIVNSLSLAYFWASVIFLNQSLHSYSYCNSKIYSLYYLFQYLLKIPKISLGIS